MDVSWPDIGCIGALVGEGKTVLVRSCEPRKRSNHFYTVKHCDGKTGRYNPKFYKWLPNPKAAK